MYRSVVFLAWTTPALLAMGCSCNQEYSFPTDGVASFDEAPPDFGSHLSFGVAPDGRRVTMAYYDRITEGLGFATGTPADDGSITWKHEQVDGYPEDDGLDRGDRGRYTSHVVAPDGTVWIAYQDSTNGSMKAAQRLAPNTWEFAVADAGIGATTTNAGNWTSIGLLADGTPIIAHFDKAGGVLRVSRKAANGWSNETAHEGDEVGAYADLVVSGDTVYVAFYNATNGNLEMIEGTPGSWTHTIIDSAGDVGQWPSVVVNDDEVLVAYHHVGDQDLKLARRSGGSWSTEVIDSGEFVGADTDLFFKDGLPQVVYFDGRDNDIRLASQTTDGSWSLGLVAGSDRAVGFFNEVAEVNGRWFLGSYDHTNSSLFTTELYRDLRD